MHSYIDLCVCLCLFFCLIDISANPCVTARPICLTACLSVCPTTCPFVSTCLHLSLSNHLPVSLPVRLSVPLSVRLRLCLSPPSSVPPSLDTHAATAPSYSSPPGPLYQMHCPSTASGVANMYSFSGTTTPSETPRSISRWVIKGSEVMFKGFDPKVYCWEVWRRITGFDRMVRCWRTWWDV